MTRSGDALEDVPAIEGQDGKEVEDGPAHVHPKHPPDEKGHPFVADAGGEDEQPSQPAKEEARGRTGGGDEDGLAPGEIARPAAKPAEAVEDDLGPRGAAAFPRPRVAKLVPEDGTQHDDGQDREAPQPLRPGLRQVVPAQQHAEEPKHPLDADRVAKEAEGEHVFGFLVLGSLCLVWIVEAASRRFIL